MNHTELVKTESDKFYARQRILQKDWGWSLLMKNLENKIDKQLKGDKMKTEQIRLEEVAEVYSGRLGCMCGCRGNYTTIEDNKAVVSRIVNTMNKLLESGAEIQKDEDCRDRRFIGVDSDTRSYTAYLKEVK